ncbi:sugar transferase [Poseidonibacter lekithochrous]|uniref:sugar transferase n=1 Tax=Poseidonibacter lekithochrous TaxID=1904463 RepID=UPI000D3505F8|nr:sugar transferase [Poseidonibacter lekithochrous]
MLVLGRKYKFTKIEEDRLQKKRIKLTIIKYTNKEAEEILEEIKIILNTKKYKTIILNTKGKVDDKIIKYLTDIQFEKNINIINIEYFMETYLNKCYIPDDHQDLNYLVNIKPFSKFQYFQKRLIDYIGSITLLLISWPILLLARRKIKKQSPGTSMFKQLRIGLNNKEFKCIKFRSMKLDAEKDGAQFASENDPRVFAWGETMRKTRIDEIPQVLNVLKGDMHFIGPRPERAFWIKQFEKEIPYYNERHIIRPGITGWAQVMYPYGENEEDAKQKLMYDLYYIKYWNILFEIKVVWKTILIVIGKKGI